MLVQSHAADVVYTSYFSGVHGNYRSPSIARAGLEPRALPESDPGKMDFGARDRGESRTAKAWKDIWGCGQGIGAIDAVRPTAERVDRLAVQYAAARARVCGN